MSIPLELTFIELKLYRNESSNGMKKKKIKPSSQGNTKRNPQRAL